MDEDAVWSELGHAYLAAGQVPDAIAAYLRSNDVSKYAEVIDACKGEPPHGVLGGMGWGCAPCPPAWLGAGLCKATVSPARQQMGILQAACLCCKCN